MHRRLALALAFACLALLLLAGCGSTRAESSMGAGMRPAALTDSPGIDRTSSESPAYHRYDP